MDVVLASLTLFALVGGHIQLWVAAVNRLHGFAVPRREKHLLTAGQFAAMGLMFLGAVGWGIATGFTPTHWGVWFALPTATQAYLVLCLAATAAGTVQWLRRLARRNPPCQQAMRREHVRELIPRPVKTTGRGRWLHLPGNEILALAVVRRTLEVPRLPAALEGLSLVHLSDTHFTGIVPRRYFEAAVERCNRLQPDLVAVTGDLVDREGCIDWVEATLGRLRARLGVYVILGNHDRAVDHQRLRRKLGKAGLTDLGGRWIEVEAGGHSILLAGNELPWFGPAADLSGAPATDLAILLAHSPDQLGWARRRQFDLMLAGHNHGGQIRIPPIGPVFSPSLHGVFYSDGLFAAPPTILHVSRGLSAKFPVRLGCPPEITHLILTTAAPARERGVATVVPAAVAGAGQLTDAAIVSQR